jgi:hypothetical protein
VSPACSCASLATPACNENPAAFASELVSSAAATAGTVCQVNALRPWWAVAYLAGNAQRAHPKRDRISGRLQLGLHHAHACAQELTSAWISRCAIWPGLPAAFSCSGLVTSLMLKRKREAGHRIAIFLTVMLSIALTLPLRSVGAAIRFRPRSRR